MVDGCSERQFQNSKSSGKISRQRYWKYGVWEAFVRLVQNERSSVASDERIPRADLTVLTFCCRPAPVLVFEQPIFG